MSGGLSPRLSRGLAVAVLLLTVPLSLWLIPEPPAPKATDVPVLPPIVVNNPPVVDPHPEEAIRMALDRYYDALNAHDAARVAQEWASLDDVVVDLPGGENAKGPAQVKELYRRMLGINGLDHVEKSRVRMRVLGGRAEVALMETIFRKEKGVMHAHRHVATHVLFKTDDGWRWVAHRRMPEMEMPAAPDGGE